MNKKMTHLWAIVILVLLYISISVFLYAYISTNGENLKKLTPNQVKSMWILASVFTLFLALFILASLMTGLNYLSKIDTFSQRTRHLIKINGILLMLGGLFISLPLSIYLFFVE